MVPLLPLLRGLEGLLGSPVMVPVGAVIAVVGLVLAVTGG